MQKLATLVVAAMLIAPAGAAASEPAQGDSETLLESALNRAAAMQAEPVRVRSMGRTWTGVALLGGGTVLAAWAAASTCTDSALAAELLDTQTCGQAWTKFGAGAGTAAIGVLLATVWSDVPALRSMSFGGEPGGFRATAAIGW